MNSKKQRQITIITMITMAAVIILGFTIGLVVFFKLDMGKFITNRGSRIYSPAEIEKIESLAIENGKQIHTDDIKKQLDSGIGINTLVRNMFPDQFVYTVGGRYYFTPINYELKQNKLVNANFIPQDNGEIVYKDFYIEIGDEKLQNFETNAIAILFPYMRAIISTYTANANLAPVILPPMNINAYLKRKNRKGE